MPKIVDHEKQRETFARAAMRLMALDGLEGVTMRAVASEAGLSYGSLFHYFSSKEELLMHAVECSTSSQTQRVNESTSRYSGLRALEALLLDDVLEDDPSQASKHASNCFRIARSRGVTGRLLCYVWWSRRTLCR